MTCNSTCGQPVSLQNIKEVSALARKYGIMLVFDAARFAENAYFIKLREKGYENKSIREIVKEMFSYADAMTMSCKKDAIVNMGGLIGLRDEVLYKKLCVNLIMFEGYITYGGVSGRDLNAIAQGLYEGIDFHYLETRINQVAYLGSKLKGFGIPIQEPFGGHAIFVDAKLFLNNIPKEEFRGQTLAIEMYIEGGVRGTEIGTLAG